jgi:hypothetical protein
VIDMSFDSHLEDKVRSSFQFRCWSAPVLTAFMCRTRTHHRTRTAAHRKFEVWPTRCRCPTAGILTSTVARHHLLSPAARNMLPHHARPWWSSYLMVMMMCYRFSRMRSRCERPLELHLTSLTPRMEQALQRHVGYSRYGPPCPVNSCCVRTKRHWASRRLTTPSHAGDLPWTS